MFLLRILPKSHLVEEAKRARMLLAQGESNPPKEKGRRCNGGGEGKERRRGELCLILGGDENRGERRVDAFPWYRKRKRGKGNFAGKLEVISCLGEGGAFLPK